MVFKTILDGILKMTCLGPYETEEDARKNCRDIWWTVEPTTLGVFKYQPQFTKTLLLHFKHTYANVGITTFKP